MTSCRPSRRTSLPSLSGTSVCTRSFRSLVDECPTKAGSWLARCLQPGNSAEETAGSRKFLGNLDCPFAHVQSTPAGRLHQTITVQPRGPWYEKSKGSHERPFDAQWHSFWTGCLRFAVRVAHAPRKTHFRPLVRRYRTGFPPARIR